MATQADNESVLLEAYFTGLADGIFRATATFEQSIFNVAYEDAVVDGTCAAHMVLSDLWPNPVYRDDVLNHIATMFSGNCPHCTEGKECLVPWHQ